MRYSAFFALLFTLLLLGAEVSVAKNVDDLTLEQFFELVAKRVSKNIRWHEMVFEYQGFLLLGEYHSQEGTNI